MVTLLAPPELLVPPPPLLLSSPPHAATPSANAAARQPVAAMNFDCKEPLLMRLVFGRRFYARPDQACNSLEGGRAEVRAAAHPPVWACGARGHSSRPERPPGR